MAAETSGGLIKSSFTVHPDQLARLERVSRERRISKSVILREAIDEKLDRLERGASVLEPERVA
jgi:predicted transcriptional regulator